MAPAHIQVKTHWLNGWFIGLFARPFVVVDHIEYETAWGSSLRVTIPSGTVCIGAGIRYTRRGQLLGWAPQQRTVTPTHQASAQLQIIFRNGPWNHSPFAVARWQQH